MKPTYRERKWNGKVGPCYKASYANRSEFPHHIVKSVNKLLNRTSFVEKKNSLDTELSTSPMSTVLVVLDFVVSLHAEPWWDWAVLAGSLGQSDLCLEALLAWLFA